MQLAEPSFKSLISEARSQFVIPVWQRLYSWEKKMWDDLWDDLVSLYEKICRKEPAEHFLGPIVVKTTEEKVGEITRRMVIDGQQRLTTLLLICALIRDKAKVEDKKDLANEIEETILFNKYAKKIEDKNKLRLTKTDRKIFDSILKNQGSEEFEYGSQLNAAFNYFRDKLENNKDKFDLEKLRDSIYRFKMVTIRLDEKDNPNRIFETLNFRGKELAQSDLVRNYFMMAIEDETKAEQIYNDIWFPMQHKLGANTLERMRHLETFLRHYLVMYEHATVNKDRVYSGIRSRLKNSNEDKLISELKTIRKYAQYYERLIYPTKIEKPRISNGVFRLNRLKIGVHYPFLLKVFEGFYSGKIDNDDFCVILKTIESYIVRRFFQRMPTNSLNKLFASLCNLPEDNIAISLQKVLIEKKPKSAQYWPTDEDFGEKFSTTPIYDISPEKCRFVLETLEESLGHPERPKLEDLEIEHIMPKTPSEEWKSYLGESWEIVYGKYLHVIPNLTLIAPSPNESIKNKLFAEKKEEWYSKSNVELTKEVIKKWDRWTANEVKERSDILKARAIKIWKRPASISDIT